MMNSLNNWKIRDAVPEDLPFIYATWSKSYRYDSPLGSQCKNSIFFPNYHRVMDSIMAGEECRIFVACKYEEPEVIFGYAVFEPGIMHYVFVKQAFTKKGIANSLFEAAGKPKTYTHETSFIKQKLDHRLKELNFNPFLLWKTETHDG